MSEQRGQASEPGTTDDVDLDQLVNGEAEPEPEPEPEPDDGGEPEPGEEPEPQPAATGAQPQQRQPSRSTDRIRALNDRLESERRAREALEREIAQLRAPPQPQAPPPNPQAEAERERQEVERIVYAAQAQGQDPTSAVARYYAEKSEQKIQQQLLRANLEIADRMDRQSFEATKREFAIARRLSDRVESELARMRQQGLNPARDAVLKYLVGEEILAKANTQVERQRKAGARQIAAQTVPPAQTRSTAPPERGQRQDNSLAAIEARWGDTPI
jgi:hypothetical protein